LVIYPGLGESIKFPSLLWSCWLYSRRSIWCV